MLSHSLASPLNSIFNISLSTSKLPSTWKTALITPIFKKGLPSDPSNYRPISLTSSACKLLESSIKDHLTDHLICNNLISKHQFGFLSKRSTVTQLLECCNAWQSNLSLKQQTEVVYLDFAKAFDSVSHPKLLHKLECYGITGLTLKWIGDFLTNRTQAVKVGSSISSYTSVSSGVPQGSVLGPILFLVFINDICNILDSDVVAKLFADDVKLFINISDESSGRKIQTSLDNISIWCKSWQLHLSPTKCAVLSLGPKKFEIDFSINGIIIPRATFVTDLGISIDPKLSFHDHINKMCAKASQRSALILKCFTSREPKLLIKAFCTFVRPLLEYASVVWSPYLLCMIDKIESVQRHFTKRLRGLYNIPYTNRLAILGIDSLELRRLKADLCMYFRILKNQVDLDSKTFFNIANSKFNTRGHPLKLLKPHSISNVQLNFFNHRAINAWNNLSAVIVQQPNIKSFKATLNSSSLINFCSRF